MTDTASDAALRFDDRVVVISGAGNGLGRSHARLFAERGAKVVVNDLGTAKDGIGQDHAAADLVVEEIRAASLEAVANHDSVTEGDKIIQQAMDCYGRVDVVINNAGILRDKSFHKMNDEYWQQILDVHLNGAYKMTRAAYPYLREQQYGRLIFTASAAGMYGNFGQANYGAAKMGLFGFMRALAIEGRGKHIHANAIAPMVDSRMLQGLMPDEWRQQLKPELVSPLVAYLCHESCTETASLFEVGAGKYCKVRWQRAAGLDLSDEPVASIESVAAGFEQACNFEQADYPDEVLEAGMHMLRLGDMANG